MNRYAKLVEESLSRQSQATKPIDPIPVKLTLPVRFPGWLPGSLRVWADHLWILFSSKKRILDCQPDIIHVLDGSYGYMANRLAGVPTIVTVHDLIPLLQQQKKFGPDQTSFLSRRLVKMTLRGLRNCRALVAVSRNTHRDIVEAAGITDKEISVIPIALDGIYLEAIHGAAEAGPGSTEDHSTMILHVGNNGHYKNREGTLRIFSRIRAVRESRLVMAGTPPSVCILRLVEELGLGDCVDFMADVDDAALCDLYGKASIFLFPSIYEGFGWPPLEAMACGCPVVCSSEASLPEVVGDAALMAPAGDESQLAELCLSVLDDPLLADSLIEKGREHARQFTIERMGRQLLAVYEHVLEQHVGQTGEDSDA